MKFDLISDFHVEMNDPFSTQSTWRDGDPTFYNWPRQKKSDVLVIAGDSSNRPEFTIEVVKEARAYYESVLFVDGNHEHYVGYQNHSRTVGRNMNELRKFATETPGVTYLDGEITARFGSTLVIGANGWYDWKGNQILSREMQHMYWKSDSNDATCIRFDPDGYADKLARSHADQLVAHVTAAQSDEAVDKILVITHTIPNLKGIVPDSHRWGYLNGSYANTEMQRVVKADTAKKIKIWVYGHTHFLYDFVDQGVRYVTNPRGYRGEKRSPDFTGIKQIDLDDIGSAFGGIDV